MQLTVVVPTRSRPEDVARLLPTIATQSRMPDQLVVVDQSHDDRTFKLARDAMGEVLARRCVYVHDSTIKGVSAARNVGIDVSTGDVVVFLDDDVTLSPDCLEQLELAFETNPEYAAIGGVELQMEQTARSYLLYYDVFFLGPLHDRKYSISRNWRRLSGIQPVTAVKTCLAGFRREFLLRNRFDERWRSALLEDVEICWRVRRHAKFGIWPAASAWHHISEVRAAGATGYRSTGAAWVFFMRSLFHREWALTPLYAWLWIGLTLNALRRSVTSRSIGPLGGLLQGAISLFRPSLALPFIDATAEPFPSRRQVRIVPLASSPAAPEGAAQPG